MHSIEYINCRICGSGASKFLGVRGNREYAGAPSLENSGEHIMTNVVRCKKCGFVYTNPLIIHKTEGYNDPNTYLSSSGIGAGALFNFTLNFIEKYSNKGKILDVGCGKGEFLFSAKKRGWEPYGVEPSENLANFASKEYGLNIRTATVREAVYPDDFFDVITLNMVLEHVDDPKQLLSEIRRILKPKGLLFIEVPNTDSFMLKAAALYFRLKGKNWSPLLSPLHYPFHCYGYNISSLKHLLAKQDFNMKKLLVNDSSLRGFRPDSGGAGFEKTMRNAAARMGNLLGKGDVLMVIAER